MSDEKPPTPETRKRFVLSAEAAEYLGISQGHLRRLASQGRLPVYKPTGARGRTYYSLDELQGWIERSRVAPVAR